MSRSTWTALLIKMIPDIIYLLLFAWAVAYVMADDDLFWSTYSFTLVGGIIGMQIGKYLKNKRR